MAGLCNIKLANTKQAKVIYNHTYTKEKLLLEKGIYFELCKIIFIYFTNGRYIDLCDQENIKKKKLHFKKTEKKETFRVNIKS